jgi:predicted dehydrogenase
MRGADRTRTPLGVALFGCGAVSQLYYGPALNVLERQGLIQVTALWDPDADSLDRLKRLFPLAAVARSATLAAQQRSQLAIIASPPAFHAAQAVEAMRAGMGVLCEKPMATTTVEGRMMIDTAAATGRVLAIGLVRRYFPATQMIADLLKRGWLGEILSVHGFEGGKFEWPVRSPSYFADAPGGVLLDIGIHTLDLLLWWLGEMDEVEYQDDAIDGIEVNCQLRLRFRSGVTGKIRLSRDWPCPNHLTIRGSNGWLRWEINEADSLWLGLPEGACRLQGRLHASADERNGSRIQPAPDFHQSFLNQLRNVVAAVHGDQAVLVSGEEGFRSLSLIEQCYRSRSLMQMPWFNESEQAQASRWSKGAP